MTILRFTKGLIFYWVALIFLSKIVISSLIPKSKGFEKIIGDENKIKNVPMKAKPKKSEGEYIEWLSKHQYSSGEIQTSREKEVYRDLQSLLERLKEFRFKNASQLNYNDKAVLLLHEKIEKSILKDFEKLFKRISKNIYPDNFTANSQM
ncbi:hypothetical protein BY996DRAFT_7307888 [Phakopsora pachyrhizi]|nr:hypothetical protein BY996DRAFT_7307888 [Phakopsora pachyrhizi]